MVIRTRLMTAVVTPFMFTRRRLMNSRMSVMLQGIHLREGVEKLRSLAPSLRVENLLVRIRV